MAQNYNDTIHLALQSNHPQTHMQKQTTKNNLTIYYKTKKHQSQKPLLTGGVRLPNNYSLAVCHLSPRLNLLLQAGPTFAKKGRVW